MSRVTKFRCSGCTRLTCCACADMTRSVGPDPIWRQWFGQQTVIWLRVVERECRGWELPTEQMWIREYFREMFVCKSEVVTFRGTNLTSPKTSTSVARSLDSSVSDCTYRSIYLKHANVSDYVCCDRNWLCRTVQVGQEVTQPIPDARSICQKNELHCKLEQKIMLYYALQMSSAVSDACVQSFRRVWCNPAKISWVTQDVHHTRYGPFVWHGTVGNCNPELVMAS
jgi:hypothetical protein